jgi:hypothetical protein
LKNARKFDIREEYFVSPHPASSYKSVHIDLLLCQRHYSKHAKTKDDWDNVRVPRPEGLANWGEAPQQTRKPEIALIRK